MENQWFTWKKISEHITRIKGIAKELMYLVEGEKEAVLIDTGVGIGNLRELIEALTDKPVTVLLSHGHVDHALGAGLFQQVYMNPLDEPVFKENSRDCHKKHFLRNPLSTGKYG